MGIDVSKIQGQKSQKRNDPAGEKKSVFDFLNKDIKFFGNQLKDQKKESFYSELTTLFSAGVDIKTALELIEEEQEKQVDQALFRKIKDNVVAGTSLSDAIEQSGKFSPYEFHSLRIGEESGKLTYVLTDLAKFFSRKINQQRQIVSALTYPAIVFTVAFGAVFFMMNFIVPMFADVFKRFGGELPAITQFIIDLSDSIANNWFYLFVIITGSVVFIYSQRNSEWFRKYSSMLILKTPVVGEIVRKIYLARFCHSMNLLISAQTPIIKSLEMITKMIGFYPVEQSLNQVQKDVLSGKTLSEGLRPYSIYGKKFCSLIKVAEEVNQLDMMFDKLADQYTNEVEHQTSLISSLIEPLMIIFLGAMVSVILIAMYLPLFQLSSSFQ